MYLCVHLLAEGWKEPRCVQACPTETRRVLNVEAGEMEQVVKEESLEVLHAEYRTRPRVYYKSLYRYSGCFIAGDVAFRKNGLIECAEGARVILSRDSHKIGETLTDNYGDFKFDGLEEQSGLYILEILFEDCRK